MGPETDGDAKRGRPFLCSLRSTNEETVLGKMRLASCSIFVTRRSSVVNLRKNFPGHLPAGTLVTRPATRFFVSSLLPTANWSHVQQSWLRLMSVTVAARTTFPLFPGDLFYEEKGNVVLESREKGQQSFGGFCGRAAVSVPDRFAFSSPRGQKKGRVTAEKDARETSSGPRSSPLGPTRR